MKTALEVRRLTLAHGDKTVLREVSFQVTEGEFFVVIGPNGSGKSSLMRCLAGAARPRSGEVEAAGRGISSWPKRALAQHIAWVPQEQPVGVPFTVADVVLMGRSPHLGLLGIEKTEDRRMADEAMEFMGVGHLSRRPFDRLSTGERQKVLIARAVCQRPRILLLDEPTASLDLAHQIQVMELMEALRRREGTTVVMVSHDLNLAAMYAHRLLLVKDGRVMRLGTPDEVLTYDVLEATYGCVLLVDRNPVKDVPRITLVPREVLNSGGRD